VFALNHYNAAIRELQTPHNPDLVLTLMSCLLFVCIEVLQSNADAAIRHCYHGINLLGTSNPPEWALHHLLPIFRRLSVLPFYFGNSQPLADCPPLTQPCETIYTSFSSFSQAQASMDAIYNLTIQLFRRTGDYRLGEMRNQPAEPSMFLEQDQIHQCLDQWRSAFDRFEAETPAGLRQTSESCRIWIFQQYEVCIILSNVPFVTDETDYDIYMPNFKRMVEGAKRLAGMKTRSPPPTEFHFEMGYAPFLFFVAIKCRHLETRIEALRLMSVLCAAQESLWNSHTLQAVAQRTIDLEHCITGQAAENFSAQYDSLPPDDMRVRHFVLGPAESGQGSLGREITFYMPAKDGSICIKRERLPIKQLNEALEGAPGVFEVDLEMERLSLYEIEDSETSTVSSHVESLL
jgi:hypothetical protein